MWIEIYMYVTGSEKTDYLHYVQYRPKTKLSRDSVISMLLSTVS